MPDYIVTEQTAITADDEQTAVERVVNALDGEVVAQYAEPAEGEGEGDVTMTAEQVDELRNWLTRASEPATDPARLVPDVAAILRSVLGPAATPRL